MDIVLRNGTLTYTSDREIAIPDLPELAQQVVAGYMGIYAKVTNISVGYNYQGTPRWTITVQWVNSS